ncbi:hypothetical protein [Actinophytocola oryzae]|uniref:Uncharacterized protein n=1 Tax=Actinophytocola oryzae TaxID=502181 RepID=A0A4R7UN76_9PSEU|nr:hypothetical protein [Actinophytocola oryzae]TDV33977.1 hypothetical protein CLV71_1462 [Actinophytocola oryzae]
MGVLVSAQDIGHFYLVTFDHGVEIEMVLPGTGHAVRFVDQPGQTLAPAYQKAAGPRNYGVYRMPFRRRFRAIFGRRASA